MNLKKSVLTAAVLSAVGGTATMMPTVASALVLADGTYNVYVNATPTGYASGIGSFYKVGKDGAWNSTFTFGGGVPTSTTSQGMTDNGATSGTGQGSGIGGDGYAGNWVISVSGGTVSFVSFSQDTIFGTAGGDFAQYGTVTGTGTIDQNTGAMSISPTGRLGAINSPVMSGAPWNIDNCAASASGCSDNGNTAWKALTTGTANSFTATGTPTAINGAAVTATADVDSDGLADFSAILVSGGRVGSAWGSFFGAGYFETYNVRLEFISGPTTVVPIPAAAWLFGSGLLGLAAVARRKKKA